jgi:hypothetical protein
MKNLPTSWLLLAVLACGACESAPTEPPIDPFIGRWSCTQTRTLTFTTPAGSPDSTTQSRFLLNTNVADGKLSTYEINEAGAPCRLDFTEKGTSALLMDGQACMSVDGITLTYKMGTADLGATGLQTNLLFDFAGMLGMDGGAPLDSTGSGTITSLCAKMYGSGASGGGATGGGGW